MRRDRAASRLRLLCLSRYGRLGASSRLRLLQYFPHFEEAGIEVTHHALLSDDYVSDLYRGRRNWKSIMAGYAGHAAMLLDKSKFDAVLLEKETWPWLPHAFDRALLGGRVPYVLDIDDAIFHNYDLNKRAFVRRLLATKIDRLMGAAACVVGGNEYLCDRARRAGAKVIELIPTVVDLARYPANARFPSGLTIGWTGSPATQDYLKAIVGPLHRVRKRTGARIVFVGASSDPLPGVGCEIRAWSEATEADAVAEFDIGIMPIPDGPWERGKCAYKLVQYMACARPVVASAVGANVRVVREHQDGFLARTTQDWESALMRLLDDATLRGAMGTAGRRRVEREYSLQATAPAYVSVLRSVSGINSRRARTVGSESS